MIRLYVLGQPSLYLGIGIIMLGRLGQEMALTWLEGKTGKHNPMEVWK